MQVTLKELAPLLVSRVASGGCLVLSGVLCEQAVGVSETFASHGIALSEASTKAGWTMLVGRKLK